MKSFEEIIDYNKLEEVVIVSNTPSYLYSNFQKNHTIADLSFCFSDQDLINIFYTELNKPRTFRNLVNLYSVIIAMSFKDSVYTHDFFIKLKGMKDIKWASELADFYFSRASYTSVPGTTIYPTFSAEQSTQEGIEFENLEFS